MKWRCMSANALCNSSRTTVQLHGLGRLEIPHTFEGIVADNLALLDDDVALQSARNHPREVCVCVLELRVLVLLLLRTRCGQQNQLTGAASTHYICPRHGAFGSPVVPGSLFTGKGQKFLSRLRVRDAMHRPRRGGHNRHLHLARGISKHDAVMLNRHQVGTGRLDHAVHVLPLEVHHEKGRRGDHRVSPPKRA